MITLFESTATTFTTNGLGSLSQAVSCFVFEEVNGEFELELEYPITGRRFNDLTERRIIFTKPNPYANPQPFRIYKIGKPLGGVVTVYAEHISYDTSGCPVDPFTATSASDALVKMKAAAILPCPFTFWTDKVVSRAMAVVKPTSMRFLLGGADESIRAMYDGEYEFDGYTVKLWNQRGANRGMSISYGKNLIDFKQEENVRAVYTGVCPFWYSEKDGLVELAEKYISAEGTYEHIRIMPLDLSSEFEAKPTEAQVRSAAQTYMQVNSIGVPKVSLTVSFVQIAPATVYLGDTINVLFPKLNVSTTTRCVRTTYNAITDKYETIELGEILSNLATTVSKIEKDTTNLDERTTTTEKDVTTVKDDVTTVKDDATVLDGRVTDAEVIVDNLVQTTNSFEIRITSTETGVGDLDTNLETRVGSYIDGVAGTAKIVSAASAVYQTKDAMTGYVLNSNLTASIEAYVDSVSGKAHIVSALSGTYQTVDAMTGYVLNSSLNASIGAYIDSTTGTAKVVSAVSAVYQTKDAMTGYVLNSSLNASIGAYIDSTTGTAKVVSAVSGTYQTISGMTGYVTTTTLNSSMGAYIDGATGTAKVVSACSGTYETVTNVATINSTVNSQGASIALVVGTGKLVSAGGTVSASVIVDTVNGGVVNINAARINFTGFTTFLRSSDLGSSGTTSIDGARIQTGVIDAERINTTDIILKKIYNASGATAVDCTISSYLCIGGTYGSSAGFDTIRLFATGNIICGSYTYTSRALTIDTVSTVIYSTYAYWKLGSSTYPFEEVRTNKLFLGGTQMELYNEFLVKKIYATGSTTYCVSLDSSYDLVPYNSTSFSLGSTSYWWADAYIKQANFGVSTTDGIIVNASGELRPNTNSSSYPQYLGTSTYPWHYAYIGSLSCRIGTSGTSTLGFFGYTPTTRKVIADVLTSATSATIAAKVNELITDLQAYGLLA